MSKQSSLSPLIEEAKTLLSSIKNTTLTNEKRCQLALNLASIIIKEAKRIEVPSEKYLYQFINNLSHNNNGKAFSYCFIDQCFRSQNSSRIANQLLQLIFQYGIPNTFSIGIRTVLVLFKLFANILPSVVVKSILKICKKKLSIIIKPSNEIFMQEYIRRRKSENIEINIKFAKEFVLGKQEAKNWLNIYLHNIQLSYVSSITVNPSLLFPKINIRAWDYSIEKLSSLFLQIFQTALKASQNNITKKNIIIDIDSYENMLIIVEAFKNALNDLSVFPYSAGITLQAYFPDSYSILQELTQWANERIKKGAAPIHVRIVKGAYINSEQVIASKKSWISPSFLSKAETDANFKKMLCYGLKNTHITNIHIATHNIFDIAYALVLIEENDCNNFSFFEMYAGRIKNIRKVIQKLSANSIITCCPLYIPQEFNNATPFILRRIEENSCSDNFLFHIPKLSFGNSSWEELKSSFEQSCELITSLPETPRKIQQEVAIKEDIAPVDFENEPNTDLSIAKNRIWKDKLINKWKRKTFSSIPLCIDGKEIFQDEEGIGYSPSTPNKVLYTFSCADDKNINLALECAKSNEKKWASLPYNEKISIFIKASQLLQKHREDLIGIIMADASKVFKEADHEVSEAIDIINYYLQRMEKMKLFSDLSYDPKGTFLIVSSSSMPCSSATDGIVATLISNNCAIFKPALETVLIGWKIANIFWKAGVPKEALQFVTCSQTLLENSLIKNNLLSAAIINCHSKTAQRLKKLNPCLDLTTISNGKNSIIITALADLDLAIKNLVYSAFEFAGQKYSCASIAFIEKEVYDNPIFFKKLRDMTESLPVGSAWENNVIIPPLISPLEEKELKIFNQLEKNEEWLVEPKQDKNNPNLWSPGIKLNISKKSYFFHNDFAAPLLGLMKIKNLDQGIQIANSSTYELSSGIFTLDAKEKLIWLEHVEAGNCYINRKITGSIIRREPFGGCKKSCSGHGYKAGGPNFLFGCSIFNQKHLPQKKQAVNEQVNNLTPFLEKLSLSAEQLGIWYASIANYAYWWNRMKHRRDPSKILGQDNFFGYIARKNLCLFIDKTTNIFDALRICACVLTCEAELIISWDGTKKTTFNWFDINSLITVCQETKNSFLHKITTDKYKRVRLASKASEEMKIAASQSSCYICDLPVFANGRLELINYLQEISVSSDYDRYGTLGVRKEDLRKPLL